jgi:hypothetical protein
VTYWVSGGPRAAEDAILDADNVVVVDETPGVLERRTPE